MIDPFHHPAGDGPPRATDDQVERLRKLIYPDHPKATVALGALLSELHHLRERDRAGEELAGAVERIVAYRWPRGKTPRRIEDAQKPLRAIAREALARYKEARGE